MITKSYNEEWSGTNNNNKQGSEKKSLRATKRKKQKKSSASRKAIQVKKNVIADRKRSKETPRGEKKI